VHGRRRSRSRQALRPLWFLRRQSTQQPASCWSTSPKCVAQAPTLSRGEQVPVGTGAKSCAGARRTARVVGVAVEPIGRSPIAVVGGGSRTFFPRSPIGAFVQPAGVAANRSAGRLGHFAADRCGGRTLVSCGVDARSGSNANRRQQGRKMRHVSPIAFFRQTLQRLGDQRPPPRYGLQESHACRRLLRLPEIASELIG
jgi:hypothetical protein